MTQVDFYILSQPARENFICRLVEKIYNMGHKLYIHTDSEQSAQQIDGMLWTFKQNSFLPHSILDDKGDDPISIGWGDEPGSHKDVMLNLDSNVPLFFSRFERVAEVISTEENEKKTGRERYTFYRDRGYTLNNHQI